MPRIRRRYFAESRRAHPVRRFLRQHRLGVLYITITAVFTAAAYLVATLLFG